VRASEKKHILNIPNRPLLDDKISITQQQAISIHWLTVMAKETIKSTEEAITEIDHSLAIAQKEM
jgi:hypothetical protein